MTLALAKPPRLQGPRIPHRFGGSSSNRPSGPGVALAQHLPIGRSAGCWIGARTAKSTPRLHRRGSNLITDKRVPLADVFGRDPLEWWLLGGLVVVMLGALARALWKGRLLGGRSDELDPFLVFPEDVVQRPVKPAPLVEPGGNGRISFEEERTLAEEETGSGSVPAEPSGVRPTFPVPVQPTPDREEPYRPAPLPRAPAWMERPDLQARPYVDEGSETIRLPTAADGTVQLLPGMLVMTAGPEVGKEFRFLRVGGQAVPELTIGRASGPQYRHIQLPAATVSRMHARIRFDGGVWRITNLSATNPARVNGRELPSLEEVVLLDGDRIELGEVELSYRKGNP